MHWKAFPLCAMHIPFRCSCLACKFQKMSEWTEISKNAENKHYYFSGKSVDSYMFNAQTHILWYIHSEYQLFFHCNCSILLSFMLWLEQRCNFEQVKITLLYTLSARTHSNLYQWCVSQFCLSSQSLWVWVHPNERWIQKLITIQLATTKKVCFRYFRSSLGQSLFTLNFQREGGGENECERSLADIDRKWAEGKNEI